MKIINISASQNIAMGNRNSKAKNNAEPSFSAKQVKVPQSVKPAKEKFGDFLFRLVAKVMDGTPMGKDKDGKPVTSRKNKLVYSRINIPD